MLLKHGTTLLYFHQILHRFALQHVNLLCQDFYAKKVLKKFLAHLGVANIFELKLFEFALRQD